MDLIFIVLLVYLVVLFLVAWFLSKRESVEEYLLNRKKTGLWMMTLSTVATIVGAGATVAVVSEVYNSGISYGLLLPCSFIVGMIILGILSKKIKQYGDKFNTYSIVDFFNKRFDKKNKILVIILQLALLLVWIGIQAVAFASLATVLIGIDYSIALILSAVVTILYTAVGGLMIDIVTDFIQFWIFALLFIIMTIIGLNHVGGYSVLINSLPQGHLDPFAFGGVGFFIFGVLMSGFLFLGNTAHWQRILSAKNSDIARKSFFIAIPITIVLSLMVILFGFMAAVLVPGGVKETALYILMKTILPTWLVGIGFAAVMAIIMSSVDSLIIGGSTIISKNIFPQKKLINIRIITLLFGSLGFILAFLVPDIIVLSLFVSYLALIFAPPIFAGLYSKRVSANASFYSLLIPSILLVILYPIIDKNTFMITTPIGIIIILFYDKIFKK